jgi:hypothetical protein
MPDEKAAQRPDKASPSEAARGDRIENSSGRGGMTHGSPQQPPESAPPLFQADPRSPVDVRAAAQAFAASLAEEERMLILLRTELYEGSWQAMLTDLRNRLEGKPYIFKLANRIRDDIARIEKLQAFEQEHNVDLTEFVKPPSSPNP